MFIRWRQKMLFAAMAVLLSGAPIWQASALTDTQTTAKAIEPDGTVNVPGFRLPPSVYSSEEAKAALPRDAGSSADELGKLVADGQTERARSEYIASLAPAIAKMKLDMGVTVTSATIAGYHANWVRSVHDKSHRPRAVLVNLPSGAFVFGAADGNGLIESIPLAASGRFDVVTIDYPLAPQHRFPDASIAVAAVYKALLKDRRNTEIGIYGCSSGGLLAAQAIAWIQSEHLPAPGAVGIFCASADARWAGDSWNWQRPLAGIDAPPLLDERFYYGEHDLADPLMSPLQSDKVLAKFPPALILTSTRAPELSAAVETHRRLIRNGVEANLHIWDGLGHAFLLNPDLPESREAWSVAERFFSDHIAQPRGR